MLSSKIKCILNLLAVLLSIEGRTATFGERFTWDDSRADRADYYPASFLIWPRLDNSPLLLHKANDGDNRLPIIKRSVDPDNFNLSRKRRDAAEASFGPTPTTSSRDPRGMRMNSGDSRPKQPRKMNPHRYEVDRDRDRDRYINPNTDDDLPPDSEEASGYSTFTKRPYAPSDFVTRSREATDSRQNNFYQDARITRREPNVRQVDDLSTQPIFSQKIGRDREYDVLVPRMNQYVRNVNRHSSSDMTPYWNRGGRLNYNPYEHYLVDRETYNPYSRYKSYKPKRIIYYAHLPDVDRKPLGGPPYNPYLEPYDIHSRASGLGGEGGRSQLPVGSPGRSPVAGPYNDYDNYVKRSNYYDRKKPPYAEDMESRINELNKDRRNYMDKRYSNERKLENQNLQSREIYRLPWPIRVGAQLNVKDDQRISGRQILNQMEDYNKYDGLRVKKTSENVERKEDTNKHDRNSNSNRSNNN